MLNTRKTTVNVQAETSVLPEFLDRAPTLRMAAPLTGVAAETGFSDVVPAQRFGCILLCYGTITATAQCPPAVVPQDEALKTLMPKAVGSQAMPRGQQGFSLLWQALAPCLSTPRTIRDGSKSPRGQRPPEDRPDATPAARLAQCASINTGIQTIDDMGAAGNAVRRRTPCRKNRKSRGANRL